IGVHPHSAGKVSLEELAFLRGLQANPAVVALGEMGLDYHYDFAPRGVQKAVFEAQLAMAGELNRPVVIDCREAGEDCLAIMKNVPGVRAVFHCFTGTLDEGQRILDQGYLLGFTGAMTFKKSEELRRVVAMAPADRILVETDAPYLTPEPFRK